MTLIIHQADAPKPSALPQNDVLGVTVVLLTCSYLSKEFIRIVYYVNNEYLDEEMKENPPSILQFEKYN
jgi:histone chaperone ASF1